MRKYLETSKLKLYMDHIYQFMTDYFVFERKIKKYILNIFKLLKIKQILKL